VYEFEQILVSSVDAETGVRGFVITGKENYLDPFNSSKIKLLEHVNKAKELTKRYPAQQENIAVYSKLNTAYIDHLRLAFNSGRQRILRMAKTLIATRAR